MGVPKPVCTVGPPHLLRHTALHPLAWEGSLCMWTHRLCDSCGAHGEARVELTIRYCVMMMRAVVLCMRGWGVEIVYIFIDCLCLVPASIATSLRSCS